MMGSSSCTLSESWYMLGQALQAAGLNIPTFEHGEFLVGLQLANDPRQDFKHKEIPGCNDTIAC